MELISKRMTHRLLQEKSTDDNQSISLKAVTIIRPGSPYYHDVHEIGFSQVRGDRISIYQDKKIEASTTQPGVFLNSEGPPSIHSTNTYTF